MQYNNNTTTTQEQQLLLLQQQNYNTTAYLSPSQPLQPPLPHLPSFFPTLPFLPPSSTSTPYEDTMLAYPNPGNPDLKTNTNPNNPTQLNKTILSHQEQHNYKQDESTLLRPHHTTAPIPLQLASSTTTNQFNQPHETTTGVLEGNWENNTTTSISGISTLPTATTTLPMSIPSSTITNPTTTSVSSSVSNSLTDPTPSPPLVHRQLFSVDPERLAMFERAGW